MSKVILTGYVIVPEEDFDAIAEATPEHIRSTLAEPKCLSFKVTPDKTNPLRFTIYEEFTDHEGLQYHQDRLKNTHWAKVTKNMERHFSILIA